MKITIKLIAFALIAAGAFAIKPAAAQLSASTISALKAEFNAMSETEKTNALSNCRGPGFRGGDQRTTKPEGAPSETDGAAPARGSKMGGHRGKIGRGNMDETVKAAVEALSEQERQYVMCKSRPS